jgi:MerR family transcriptional regulator, aldehyde-responsive regulator
MYSISQAAARTGLTAYTIRYYEKIGLLPPSHRKGSGIRVFDEKDLNFMLFLHALKKTGMSLEDMTEFVQDGCIIDRLERDGIEPLGDSMHRRTEILAKHLLVMQEQRREMDRIIALTEEKLDFYRELLAQPQPQPVPAPAPQGRDAK